MKVLVAVLCMAAAGWAQSGDDSSKPLGDVARTQRAGKPAATKVYTNENMPHSGGISVVGDKKANAAAAANEPATDQRSIDSQWRQRLDQQKAVIANLEHQLSVAQENERRSTHRYPIGGNPNYERFKDQIDSLTQQIEDAKKQLADLQDEAHRAGANKAYD